MLNLHNKIDVFQYETVRHIGTKKIYLFWLPFENMTYEMKEKTFIFTIWRKKVAITDIFENVFFSSIEK